MERITPWLALFALYAAAALLLDAVAPVAQEPRLLNAVTGWPRELVLAATATVAFAFAAPLARRWAPDPWAGRAVALAALSPAGFALAQSTAAVPAVLLTAGTLGAVLTRDHPTRLRALGGGGCLALAPWFGVAYAVPAAPVLAALVYWSYRRGRRLYAFLALEFAGATVVTLAGLETSVAGHTPGPAGVRDTVIGAPVLVLVVLTAFLLARSRREKLARAIPAWRDAELSVGLTGSMLLAVGATALWQSLGPEAGLPAAGALGAWGLRAYPRIGALVAAITVGLSAWAVIALATSHRAGWL